VLGVVSAPAAGAVIGAALPPADPRGEEIIAQVWYVNHLRAVRNFGIVDTGAAIPYLVYKTRRDQYRFRTLERFLKNDHPAKSGVLSQDMAVFYFPQAIRGTGILITDFADPDRNQLLQIWLPALRKVRRFPEPNQDDAYAGSDWTYGDVSLRKPNDERHQLLRVEPFDAAAAGGGEIHVIPIPEQVRPDFVAYVPTSSSEFRGRECYVVKSSTKFDDFWYDYRVSWVDRETFADYRTLYYKDGALVKIIDRNWQPMRAYPPNGDVADPRAQYWSLWYGKTLATGHESMAVIPPGSARWNADFPDSTWSEAQLRRLRR